MENNTKFTAGMTKVPATISPSPVQGWSIRGAGMSGIIDASPLHDFISGPCSRLFYEGPEDSYMIKAAGANWKIQDLTLLGHNAPKTNGIKISQKGGAFGGSVGLVENVGFAKFKEAIRIGETIDDHGNDNHIFDKCYFFECDHGLVLGARQAMHYNMRVWNCRSVKNLITVKGGGKLDLVGLDTECNGTILNIIGTANDIGPNNGIFNIRHITVDAGHFGKTLTLVNQTNQTWLNVVLEDIYMPLGDYDCAAVLNGPNSTLRINRIYNMALTSRIELKNGATCIISDSRLPEGLTSEILLKDGSKGRLILRNCYIGDKIISSQSVYKK